MYLVITKALTYDLILYLQHSCAVSRADTSIIFLQMRNSGIQTLSKVSELLNHKAMIQAYIFALQENYFHLPE